jgi:uncharacterized protein YndB with AHSA1/START domain
MNNFSSTSSIVINAPLEKVWEALTKPELVKQYFFGTNLVTNWEVGSPIFFRGEFDGKQYEDKGTVLVFSPMTALSFNYWSSFNNLPDTPEMRQILEYVVEQTPEGIRITIKQSNVDTQERADHSAKNWDMVLQGLKKMLES